MDIEKRMNGDVYTIENIRGSIQLEDFYKEVVAKNYEKYLAITSEGRKFGWDEVLSKPLKLDSSVEYVLNPHFVKETVEEEVVENKEEVKEEVKEAPVEEKEEVFEAPVLEEVKEETVEEAPKIDNKQVELEEKIKELNEALIVKSENEEQLNKTIQETVNIKMQLESDNEVLKNKILSMESEKETEVVEKEYTLDELVDKINKLGWKVYLTRV